MTTNIQIGYRIWLVLIVIGIGFLPAGCGGRGKDEVGLGAGARFVNAGSHDRMVRLPDSSMVVLVPGAGILVSTGFDRDHRELDLDGKAMFRIRGDSNAPFKVHTRNLQIEVLAAGSKFYVEAYRKDAGEEVILLEGKLRVTKSYHSQTDNEPELLTGGEMVMINRDIDLMEKEKMDGSEMKAWDAGK